MIIDKQKLEIAMARQCLGRQALIEKAGIPKSTLINAAAGKEVRPLTCGRLARALGCDVLDIVEVVG